MWEPPCFLLPGLRDHTQLSPQRPTSYTGQPYFTCETGTQGYDYQEIRALGAILRAGTTSPLGFSFLRWSIKDQYCAYCSEEYRQYEKNCQVRCPAQNNSWQIVITLQWLLGGILLLPFHHRISLVLLCCKHYSAFFISLFNFHNNPQR